MPDDEPVRVEGTLERIGEGMVVRGTVHAPWRAGCSRCLQPVEGTIDVHVDELFETAPLEGETYLLDDDVIDLEPLVRDVLLLELPPAPLCRDDCAGICARAAVPTATSPRASAGTTNPTPAGRPCGRSNSELAGALRMAVPKRKMSRSPTRSRKSANMRARAAARTRCARTAGRPKLPHTVCGNCGWYRGRQVLEVD